MNRESIKKKFKTIFNDFCEKKRKAFKALIFNYLNKKKYFNYTILIISIIFNFFLAFKKLLFIQI